MAIQNPTEEAKLVMDIYDYALTNNLNINNKEDIKMILIILDQKNINDDRVEKLMIALKVVDEKVKTDVSRRNI